MRKLFFFFFFLSGFSALTYEVVWLRRLVLVFGNTTEATSAILTVFFFGLALGSMIIGRLADRIKNPLKLYGLLELGIGVYCLFSPFLMSRLILFETYLLNNVGEISPILLAFLVLIIPTTMIGGTFPTIARVVVQSGQESGKISAYLYSVTTLGGIVGVALAGFFLIPNLGLSETVWLAAVVNLSIGFWAVLLSSKSLGFFEIAKGKEGEPLLNKLNIMLLLVVLFNGFIALSLEVLWTRILALIVGASTYAFTLILINFLLGIALGSLLGGKILSGRKNLLAWLAFLQILMGALVLLSIPILSQLPLVFLNFLKGGSGSFFNILLSSLAVSSLVILPVTFLMGVIFFLVLRILLVDFRFLGRDLGKIYALNTLGGIGGAFFTGFFFIPILGLQRGMLISGIGYPLIGLLVLAFSPFSRRIKLIGVVMALVLFGSLPLIRQWDKEILTGGVYLYSKEYVEQGDKRAKQLMGLGELLFYKEGASATVSVKKNAETTFLRINGKTDASSGSDVENFLLAGHLPLFLHPDPKNVLVIGLGSGITLGAVEQHQVEKIDLVEIEPAVVEAASFFNDYNQQALQDKRLRIFVNDGRHFLLAGKTKYDIISSQPSNLWLAGMGNLFTKEYYELALSRLARDGLMLQWIQLYRLDPKELRNAIATFRLVFPYTSLWISPYSPDIYLIGGRKPLELTFTGMMRKLQQPNIQKDMDKIGIKRVESLLSYFLASGDGLENYTRGARIHTDNRPFLEFLAPFYLNKETVGANIQTFLPLQESIELFISDLTSEEKSQLAKNLELKENILRARINFEKRNLDSALEYFLRALELDPERRLTKRLTAEIYFNQAEVAFKRNQLLVAKEALAKSIELNPLQVLAHLNLGAIYFQEGNLGEAAQEWAIAKELDPENEDVDKNLDLLDKYLRAE